MQRRTFSIAAAATMLARPAMAQGTLAEETFTVAVGQRGAWDTSVCEFGQRAGLFREQGLALNLLYTDGGAETQQAVIAGGVEIGVGVGFLGIIAAASKDAPIRVISGNFTGAWDTFWYARADSGITSFADAGGKTVAFSAVGSSSNLLALALVKKAGVQAKLVPTGGPAATLTQVMSRQIDIGWSLPPVGFAEMADGSTRLVGNGRVFPELETQTVRCNITNAATLAARRPALVRFMTAYRTTIDWMYSDPRAISWYAEFAGTTEALARKARDENYPKRALALGRPQNLDLSLAQALELKRVRAPMTPQQIDRMLAIVEPASG